MFLKPDTPQNVQIESGTMRWDPVDNADGYNIHCGDRYIDTVIGIEFYVVPFSVDGMYSVSAWRKNPFGKSLHSPRSKQAVSLDENTMFPCPTPIPNLHGNEPLEVARDYTLVFEDDFDQAPGTLPDPAKWSSQLPWGPSVTINNEEQYYTDVLNGDMSAPNPFDFDGQGNLIISAGLNDAAQQAATGKQYYSGVLTGFMTTPFRYGYVETRLKLPKGNQGLWSAFWLLNRYYQPSPDATGANGKYETEIDWEFVRGPGGAFGGGPYDTNSAPIAYHYDGGQWKIDGNGFTGPSGAQGVSQQCDGTQINGTNGLAYADIGVDLADDFHAYGIWWEEDFIRWYLDGQLVGSICDANIVSQIDMFPILNMAIGGAFPGPADPTDYAEPVQMLVDYVCLMQRV